MYKVKYEMDELRFSYMLEYKRKNFRIHKIEENKLIKFLLITDLNISLEPIYRLHKTKFSSKNIPNDDTVIIIHLYYHI